MYVMISFDLVLNSDIKSPEYVVLYVLLCYQEGNHTPNSELVSCDFEQVTLWSGDEYSCDFKLHTINNYLGGSPSPNLFHTILECYYIIILCMDKS